MQLPTVTQRTRSGFILTAGLLLLGATVAAWREPAWHNPLRAPEGIEWWLYGRRPPRSLTSVGPHLRAVSALRDNRHVWAVGDLGTVIASSDGGATWSKLPAVPTAATQRTSPAQKSPPPKPSAPQPGNTTNASPIYPVQQQTLPEGKVTIDPADFVAGQTVRATIISYNFVLSRKQQPLVLDKTLVVTAYTVNRDDQAVIEFRILPEAVPGPHSIQIYGQVGKGTSTALGVVFNVKPAPSKAGLWELPRVYAADAVETKTEDNSTRLMAVYFRDDKNGRAVTALGDELETTDGGKQWQRFEPYAMVLRFPAAWLGADYRAALDSFGGITFGPPDSLENHLLARGPVPGASRAIFYDHTTDKLYVAPGADPGLLIFPSARNLKSTAGNLARFAAPFQVAGTPQRIEPTAISALWFHGDNGWAAAGGQILVTHDARQWTAYPAGTSAPLHGFYLQANDRDGWAAGDRGTVLATRDGGRVWRPVTQGTGEGVAVPYGPSLPPWYVIALVLSCGMFAIALLPIEAAAPETAVEIIAASDRPIDEHDPDPLSFRPIARGLAYFLRNERTEPPLTIAITGPWGTGKSSLMKLLCHELAKHGIRPVWFNAWHHQKEDYLLPSLLDAIRQQAVPRPWHPGGVAFRYRLLRARWYWWPAILILCFTTAASFEYCYRAYFGPGAAAPPASALDSMKGIGDLLASAIPLGPVILSFTGLMATIYKWLSAFGVKPAALLATTSGGARVSDLEKQTGFRYRFSQEFQEVTQALGDRQMVIFIDDIDRCSPDNAMQVLESINFLVSSGGCFVVMGIARQVVEEFVARSLKPAADAVAAAGGSEGAPKSQRDMAREYLEKLIQIEVPIPAADPQQFRDLVRSLQGAGMPVKPASAQLTAAARVVVAAGLVLMAGIGGMDLGGYIPVPGPAVAVPPAAVKASAQAATTGSAVAVPGAVASSGALGEQEMPQPVFFDPPARGTMWPVTWPAFVSFAVLLWAGFRVLTWRADLVVRDSREFVTALESVLPMVVSRRPTPRALKRFLNRIRYVAMRQREHLSDDRPLWRRMSGPLPEGAHPDTMPDEILVLLGAAHDLNPQNLDSDQALVEAFHGWVTLTEGQRAGLARWRTKYQDVVTGLRGSVVK